MLNSDNSVLSSPFEIQDLIMQFYEVLLIVTTDWRLNLDGSFFKSLDPILPVGWRDLFRLMRFIRWSMGWSKIKLLGWIVFLWLFFKLIGMLCKKMWCGFFRFFFYNKFEKSLNAIFIVLIPKIVVAFELKDFVLLSLWAEYFW